MRKWFKKLRDELDITQEAVAKKTGITRQFVGMIESGSATPHPETAKRIAESLDFSSHGYDWTKFYEEQGKEAQP